MLLLYTITNSESRKKSKVYLILGMEGVQNRQENKYLLFIVK
jgi:hypothetical protein